MEDILIQTDDYVFSYRVSGILIQNGKVLLQRPPNDSGYAFPGGHVAFGETNEESLIREFKEEIGADITVGELKWVAEIFFPWGDKPCHQICLYYLISLDTPSQIPLEGKFIDKEFTQGQDFNIEFYWIPLDEVKNIKVYPAGAVELLEHSNEGVTHFVYKEGDFCHSTSDLGL